jgi:type II secretory pathway component PulC
MEAYKAAIIKLLSYKHARNIAFAIIGLSGLWALINLTETIAIFFYKLPAQATAISSNNNQLATETRLLAQLPSWHLFGQTPLTVTTVANIPLSSLNIVLNGIFYQADAKKSQALMTDANGNTQLYSIGDIVSGGAKLYDILPDNVVIERDGQLEKLVLPDRQLTFSPAPQGLPP